MFLWMYWGFFISKMEQLSGNPISPRINKYIFHSEEKDWKVPYCTKGHLHVCFHCIVAYVGLIQIHWKHMCTDQLFHAYTSRTKITFLVWSVLIESLPQITLLTGEAEHKAALCYHGNSQVLWQYSWVTVLSVERKENADRAVYSEPQSALCYCTTRLVITFWKGAGKVNTFPIRFMGNVLLIWANMYYTSRLRKGHPEFFSDPSSHGICQFWAPIHYLFPKWRTYH